MEEEMGRRKFLNLLLGISFIAFFATLITGAIRYLYPVEKGETTPKEEIIAKTSELPVWSGKLFRVAGKPGILIHMPSGFVAYSAICTHLGCTVFWDSASKLIRCPCHGGVFDPADGSVVTGPPPSPLPRIDIEIRGEDIIARG